MISIDEIKNAIEKTKDSPVKEAEETFLALYNKDPKNLILLSTIGLFYISIRDYEKAAKIFEEHCEIKKTFAALSSWGQCEQELGNFLKASHILDEALRYGQDVRIYDALIRSLFEIRALSKAAEYSEKMYELYPKDQIAVANMVKSRIGLGKLFEAEKICVEYLKDNPESTVLWNQLGFLKELIYSDDKQALECYKIAAQKGCICSLYNIAVSYSKLNEDELAEKYYKMVIEKSPHSLEYKISYAMLLLKQKKFKEGYTLFFERRNHFYKNTTMKPWKIGENLEDEVVVISDQGFGDIIQFARYIPILKNRVKKVYFATRDSLRSILEKNLPNIEFVSLEDIDPQMQSIRITDLAFVLDLNFDNIPYQDGYLKSEKLDIKSDKIKVGLCWEAGAAGIRTMIHRSINPKEFAPFFELENIQYYSLQVGDSLNGCDLYPDLINLAKDFKNFEDTAKALLAMDYIITVDTATAHLAGALGVKTFLILPYTTDWRWFDDEKTTPWYNSIKLFRQNDPIAWTKPIEEIICELKKFSS